MKNHITSSIVLHNLELNIYLGWPDAERAQKQTISKNLINSRGLLQEKKEFLFK